MSRTWRLSLALVAMLAGAVVAVLLLAAHRGQPWGTAAVQQLCGAQTGPSPCETVARSPWAEPFGVPLAAVGVVFALAVAAVLAQALASVSTLQAEAGAKLALLALFAGLACDVLLGAVQAFSIGAFCRLCLLTYGLNALGALVLWPFRRAALSPWWTRETLPLALGTLWAVLGASASVAAYDALLRARATPGSILGTGTGTLAEAQARIRTLEQTLDDPAQLQHYLQQKALSAFERAPVQAIDLARTPFTGAREAPLKVVTYSDFLCPYCRALANDWARFVPGTGGRLAVYFKHYPLDQACNPGLPRNTHPGACWLARGAVCAHEQGRFQAYHDLVFGTEWKSVSETEVARLAGRGGLDTARFQACLTSAPSQQQVAADIAEGRRVGVEGTPTVFLNGRSVASLNMLLPALERESARLGLGPLVPAPAGPGH